MLKFIRFLLYGGMIFFVLVAKSKAFWMCIDVLKSPAYFFEDGQYLAIHISFLIIAFFYFCWLLGATFIQWRMPLWSHTIPFFLIVWMLWTNGWIFRTSSGIGERNHPKTIISPANRSLMAMEGINEFLLQHPCRSVDSKQIMNALKERKWTGYRSFGIEQKFQIIQSQGEVPVVTIPSNIQEPGTIFLVCNEKDDSFVLSSIVTSVTPQGPLSFVVDGVGKPVTMIGRLRK